ncbi:hypothetical protein FACS1894214_1350 [Planctomycetales bacterium]|nr:hypothetical protein FACS1894214_1350 [Planctomycetales bacterium]
MKKTDSYISRFFTSPFLWGGLVSFAFYAAIHRGIIDSPFLLRYFAGHEIEYITAVMFFIAAAGLIIKFFFCKRQRAALKRVPVLGPRENQKVEARFVSRYTGLLEQYEKKHGSSLLTERLKTALQFVSRCGSAEELDTELRYLSEEEFAKADADYGLVRLVLWAVPMLGFLGTVVGITMALSNLDLNAINESSKMLSAGLSVAFDTTALAIALDVTLYFIQFVVYRDESNLLWEIDRLASDELRGRFELEITGQDSSQTVAVRRMMESVILSIEALIEKQTKHWTDGMDAADRRYCKLTEQNTEIMTDMLKKALAAALSENVTKHAVLLAEVEKRFIEQTRESAEKIDDSLKHNLGTLASLQKEMLRQNDTVQQIIGAGGLLMKNEQRLNENLAALAQVGNFEETVNSLAAVIHLLNGKHSIGFHREVA